MRVEFTPDAMPPILGARIAILQAKWYREHVDKMVETCIKLLDEAGSLPPERHILPGSLELPLAAQTLLRRSSTLRYDAVICFGAIMKGETYHFEMIMNECIRGLGHVALTEGVPIIVEVIPIANIEQLIARSSNDPFNKGIEAALAAAEIISWNRNVLRK
jgi:6,7-dimethyl-8-ribityllumazine synthase